MDPENSHHFALLEKRLNVMRRLAQALQQGQASAVVMDAQQMEQQAAEQQVLCREWRAVEDEIQLEGGNRLTAIAEQVGSSAAFENPDAQRWLRLRQELGQVEMHLTHLNRVHAALLRRMRRSIAVLAHVLASSAPTYAAASFGHEPTSTLQLRK